MSQVPVQSVTNPVQQLIDRVGGPRRALIGVVGLGLAVLIFGVAQWAAAPTWEPLYSGMSLETTGQVTANLEEAGIRYELAMGGTEVRVPSSELARARVVLASAGLPESGRPGLELFDQPSWGMTDFTQRINYRRALEGELERTISRMQGVEAAKVHLAMYETASIRRLDRPAEASVVLQLRTGAQAGPDVVQGIAHLVASSVDGLSSENVTVLDGSGRLLSIPDEPGSLATLNSRQLAIQRDMETYLEEKAHEIVGRIVGPGNARIQVAVDVNFDRVERRSESVDPDRQAISTEERAEIIPGAEGGAGSTTQSSTFENSRSLEVFSGATGTVRRLSVAVLVNDRLVEDDDGARYEARSPEDLARIESLVRGAVGIDESRGDVISVVSVPFDGLQVGVVEEPAPNVLEIVAMVQRPAITVLGLLLAFIVALRVIRMLKVAPPPEPEETAEPLVTAGEAPPPSLARPATDPVYTPDVPDPVATEPILPHSSALRDKVVANVTEYPDLAARLVRAWMKEA
jgi:flagellar M-ring protein FliF